jgi:hypothetical protein
VAIDLDLYVMQQQTAVPPAPLDEAAEDAREMAIDFVHYELPAVRFVLDAVAHCTIDKSAEDDSITLHSSIARVIRHELDRSGYVARAHAHVTYMRHSQRAIC